MGGLLSNLTKLDSIINPEATKETVVESKNESTTESTDSTANAPVVSDVGAYKELKEEEKSEIITIVSEKLEDKPKEELHEESTKEGKKVEVEPVDISKMTDVIKKPTRKRKRHQMA
jgi:hypothetical protein